MKDYESAVRAVCEYADAQYGIEHTDMRAILACLLPTAPALPCWLIIESRQHVFWEHLSLAMARMSMPIIEYAAQIRIMRPRYANKRLESAIEMRSTPRIYVDYMVDEPLPYKTNARNRWGEVESECLRLRVRLSWMKTPEYGAEITLYQLIRAAVDPEFRKFTPLPLPKPPELLTHCVDLVTRANPALTNPAATFRNALILTTAHAVLHGRTAVESEDHEIVYRVLQNTIRKWTWDILYHAFGSRDGALTIEDVRNYANIKRAVVIEECGRLAEAGIIDWPMAKNGGSGRRPKYLRMDEGRGEDMREFVTGGLSWWRV